MADGQTIAGSCLCGAVRFEVERPVKWCANCHCSMCRRAHGAPYVTWVGVEAARFRFVDGCEPAVFHSSAAARRSFCAQCGTPLLFQGDRWAGEVHVARACFADDVDLVPAAHAYFSDRAPWVHVGDDLPRFGGTDGTTPIDS